MIRAMHDIPQICHCGSEPLPCDYPASPPHRFHRATHDLGRGVHYTYWEDSGEPESGYRTFEIAVPLSIIRSFQDRWPFADAEPQEIVSFLVAHALHLPPRGAVVTRDVSEP